MFSLAGGCCVSNFPIKIFIDRDLIITFAENTDEVYLLGWKGGKWICAFKIFMITFLVKGEDDYSFMTALMQLVLLRGDDMLKCDE